MLDQESHFWLDRLKADGEFRGSQPLEEVAIINRALKEYFFSTRISLFGHTGDWTLQNNELNSESLPTMSTDLDFFIANLTKVRLRSGKFDKSKYVPNDQERAAILLGIDAPDLALESEKAFIKFTEGNQTLSPTELSLLDLRTSYTGKKKLLAVFRQEHNFVSPHVKLQL